MDDTVLKLGGILVALCFVGAFATWDPASIVASYSGTPVTTEKNSQFLDVVLNVTELNWGAIYVDPSSDGSNSRTILITNSGKISGNLSLRSINWNPVEAADFIKISWDQEDALLAPGKSVPAVLVCTVSKEVPEKITDFSAELVISITEVSE